MGLFKNQCLVLHLNISNDRPVIFCLVVPVLTNVITVTEETFIDTEMCVVFLSHLVCGLLCRFQMVVGYLRLTGVLVDVTVDTEIHCKSTTNQRVTQIFSQFSVPIFAF